MCDIPSMDIEDYRQRAERAVLSAQAAPAHIRRMLLDIAQVWLVLYANARERDGEHLFTFEGEKRTPPLPTGPSGGRVPERG